MSNYEKMQEVLNGPFHYKLHVETFHNYTELVITEDGVPHYAVPSHVEFLMKLMCEKMHMTRDELNQYIVDNGLVVDYVDWMMRETGAVLVWYQGYNGHPNEAQRKTINKLIKYKCMVTNTRSDVS